MYLLNDIYTSVQGEGLYVGKPVIFTRFAKCNFSCAFCDTNYDPVKQTLDFEGLLGVIEAERELTKCSAVLLTGGEPTLYDLPPLVQALRRRGFWVGMESNGTGDIRGVQAVDIDHITISPKSPNSVHPMNKKCDELRLVVPQPWLTSDWILRFEHTLYAPACFLSPMEINGNFKTGVEAVYTLKQELANKSMREWRVSVQTHKLAGIA